MKGSPSHASRPASGLGAGSQGYEAIKKSDVRSANPTGLSFLGAAPGCLASTTCNDADTQIRILPLGRARANGGGSGWLFDRSGPPPTRGRGILEILWNNPKQESIPV